MSCKQVNTTTTSTSNQTNEIFYTYHSLSCKSKYAIHLLECSNCKIQHVGKSRTLFLIILNNHRKDTKNPITTCKHFNSPKHDFITQRKLTIIEQLRNITSSSTKIVKGRFKEKTFRLKNEKHLHHMVQIKNLIKSIICSFFKQPNSSSLCTKCNNI